MRLHNIKLLNKFNIEMFSKIDTSPKDYLVDKIRRKGLTVPKINLRVRGSLVDPKDHFSALLLQGLYIKEVYENNTGLIIVKDGSEKYYWDQRALWPTSGAMSYQTIFEATDINRLYINDFVPKEYRKRVLELL